MKIDRQELERQMFHLGLGIVIVLLLNFGFLSSLALFVIFAMGIALAIMASRWKIPVISWFLEKFERKDARFPGEGAAFYVLGCFLVIGLFPKNIASASIMVLALGDSFATLIGKSLGKRKIRDKTLEGMLAGTVTGFLGALIFVNAAAAFLGSFIAMLIEAIELKIFRKKLDDNLFIPVIAAIIMYGVAWL